MNKKFESMYSKFTKELELLSNSIRDNYNFMQENVSTSLTKVKDLYSQNVVLQEKFTHSKVLAMAVEQGILYMSELKLTLILPLKQWMSIIYNDRERRKCNVIIYKSSSI